MFRALVIAFTILVSSPALAGGIAIVDFQRAVNETNEGKAAQTKLDDMYAQRRKEIEAAGKQIEAEIASYQARATMLADSARQEEEQALLMKQQQFQGLTMQYEQEMQQQYVTLLQGLDTKMRATCEKVAKEKGYDIVLDKAAVVYSAGATVDMTDDLVRVYNASN